MGNNVTRRLGNYVLTSRPCLGNYVIADTKLAVTDGAVAVGALWRRPYLKELTARGNSPDVHAAARALLDGPRTVCITVPNRLTDHQQQKLAILADDNKWLDAALTASRLDGNVIQHLTGGPELLHAYNTSGELFTAVEHALITAGLDARRLGHQEPIPAALLGAAGDGYMSPWERPGHADWATSALVALTTGVRADGSKTDIRNVLCALKPVRTRSGAAETGYEPDDYLDQHTRRARQACRGPRQLWDALAEHASGSDDLYRLGAAARDRGLYRHAVLLWKHAITTNGNARAAAGLIDLLYTLGHADTQHASQWVAEHAALEDAFSIVLLLEALSKAGAYRAIAMLLARHPAEHAAVEDGLGVASLLEALHAGGARQAASTLAARAANHAIDEDPLRAALLLKALSKAGAGQAAGTFAARAAAHANLEDAYDVHILLQELREAGADQAISTLLARHPAEHADIQNCLGVVLLLRELGKLRKAAADEAASTLAARAAAHIDIQDPLTIVLLLGELRKAEADEAASILRARAEPVTVEDAHGVAVVLRALRGDDQAASTFATRAAEEAAAGNSLVENPRGVADLLRELRKAGAGQAAGTFAAGAAEHANLEDGLGVAELLQELRNAGADQAIATLLARHPAEHADIENPRGVAELLQELRKAGADQAIATLLARHPAEHADIKYADWESHRGVAALLEQLRMVGADEAAQRAGLSRRGRRTVAMQS